MTLEEKSVKLEIGNQQRKSTKTNREKSTKPKPDSVNMPLATITVKEYHKNFF